jgi:serine/threonine protein kinase
VNGLKAFHDHNILHRDIKADNIFVHYEGEIVLKIGDLALSVQKSLSNTMCGFFIIIILLLLLLCLDPRCIWHQSYLMKIQNGQKLSMYGLLVCYYMICSRGLFFYFYFFFYFFLIFHFI